VNGWTEATLCASESKVEAPVIHSSSESSETVAGARKRDREDASEWVELDAAADRHKSRSFPRWVTQQATTPHALKRATDNRTERRERRFCFIDMCSDPKRYAVDRRRQPTPRSVNHCSTNIHYRHQLSTTNCVSAATGVAIRPRIIRLRRACNVLIRDSLPIDRITTINKTKPSAILIYRYARPFTFAHVGYSTLEMH